MSIFETKKTFYENGKVKDIIPYTDGKKNGIMQSFYENGNIKTKICYCDGVIDGYVKTYFEDGTIESQETYTLGIKNNDLVCFNRSGVVVYSHNIEDYDRNDDFCLCFKRHL